MIWPGLTEPLARASIVESPHQSLDQYLTEMNIAPKRVDKVVSDQALIDAIRAHEAQILFKRSRVPVSQEVVVRVRVFMSSNCAVLALIR